MERIFNLLTFLGVFCVGLTALQAQTSQKGAVQDQEFIIQKDRVIRLPKKLRSLEKMPSLPQPKALGPLEFPVAPFFLAIPAAEITAAPAQKEWDVPNLETYPGLVRVGYGNYLSPLIEGRYQSTQTEDWQFATKLFHQSFGKGPVTWMGEEESKESHTELAGQGSYFLSTSELFSSLSLRRDAYRYYGEDLGFVIPPNVDFAGPVFDPNTQIQGNFKLGIRDLEKVGRIGYEGVLVLNGFKDSFAAREQELGFEGKGTYRPSKDLSGTVALTYFTTDTQDREYDLNRNYLSLRPEGTYRWGDFNFIAGFVLVSENDSVEAYQPGIRLFPVIKSAYQIGENLSVNAAISGDVQRNTYRTFVQENPFLGPSEQLLNTVTKLSFSAGVEGLVSDKLVYRAGIDLRRQSNLHFFVNSYADTSRFELVYDQDATVFQFNSSVELSLTEKYTLTTQVDFFHYNLSNQQVAWHRPSWTLQMNQRFAPFKKLNLQANLQVMGGLQARGFGVIETKPVQAEVVKLPALVDLQFNLDFAVTSRLAVFASGSNLLNRSNSRWMNYPVRGIQGVGGLSFKF
ncbi:MAG: hypothetical protein RL403_962 [Bacteroidota bacterium]|jgi:hypothetical protein